MPAPIRINNFNQGIADTPAVGFGIVKADITRTGFAKPNRAVDNMKDDFTNRVKYFTQDPVNGGTYAIDGNGEMWQKASSTWNQIGNVNTTQAEGNGLGIYKGYFIKCRRNKVDVKPVASGTWTDDWATLNAQGYSTVDHPVLWSENDKFYIGDGRFVHSINAGATFDPGTDSLTTNVLDLPSDYKIKGLAEIGKYLLVLAEQPTAGQVAIFPWNKTASSFNLPVFINESEAHAITVHLNQLYVLAGNSLYVSNLTTYSKVRDFDFILNDTDFIQYPAYGTQALAFDSDELLVGIGNNTSDDVNPVGLYSIKDGRLSLKAGISTGADGSTNDQVIVNSVFVTNDREIIFGWQDGSSYGIDIISEERDRQYNSYIITPIYTIGQPKQPTAFQQIEIILNSDLTSGDGFRISYREGVEDDWALITTSAASDGDFDFALLGAAAKHHIPATIPGTATMQFKIDLKRDINLKEIIIS